VVTNRAVTVLDRIVQHVDVLLGNEEDLQLGLGIPGPEVAARSKLDPSAFLGMMENVRRKHPQVKIVATHAARSPFDESPPLGGGGVDGRPRLRFAHVRTGRP